MKEILNLLSVDRMRMSPIEGVEGFNEGQSGIGDTTLDTALLKAITLSADQVGKEV